MVFKGTNLPLVLIHTSICCLTFDVVDQKADLKSGINFYSQPIKIIWCYKMSWRPSPHLHWRFPLFHFNFLPFSISAAAAMGHAIHRSATFDAATGANHKALPPPIPQPIPNHPPFIARTQRSLNLKRKQNDDFEFDCGFWLCLRNWAAFVLILVRATDAATTMISIKVTCTCSHTLTFTQSAFPLQFNCCS